MSVSFHSPMFLCLVFLFSCVFLDEVWARAGIRPGHVHSRTTERKIHLEEVDRLGENLQKVEEAGDKKEGENVDDTLLRRSEDQEDDDGEDESMEVDPLCPDCGRRRSYIQARLKEDEMKKLIIEDIKRQILRKLRLKAPPQVTTPVLSLPVPLAIDEMGRNDDAFDTDTTKDIDDYYGRTERIIILPDEESGYECPSARPYPAICIYFQLSSELPKELTSIDLWVYKERERRHFLNQSLTVSDLHLNDHHKHKRHKHIEAETQSKYESGWIKYDVKHVVRHWLHHRDSGLNGFEISCPSCNKGIKDFPIASNGKHRPFLLMNTAEGDVRTRTKRSANCATGTTQCCRQKLFVSFKDLGWDSWIVQPQGYLANYCRGSCQEDGAIPLSTSAHSSMLLRVSQTKVKLSLCCTPARMSSLTMLYVDTNGTLVVKKLPNMVVESCGCS